MKFSALVLQHLFFKECLMSVASTECADCGSGPIEKLCVQGKDYAHLLHRISENESVETVDSWIAIDTPGPQEGPETGDARTIG